MKRMLSLLSALVLASGTLCATAQPYSNAVNAGDFLYVSGQFPIDPSTGQMVQGEMTTLTNLVLDNIQHLLHLNGYKMNQVIKTEVYLTDVRDYDAMNSVYASRFPYQYPPARDIAVVQNLLNNATIEISCIAYKLR